ncbi:MAG: hypothetical protein GY943_14575 [Chloroflexi bacterium]|nr:hypothetical protein [Chloroflexota bacterium]
MTEIILPPESNSYRLFQQIAAQQRVVFLAGLPGTGKSLLLQQLALMAAQAGRTVHLLQYDVARMPFETPENLAKYPEIDGFTHAGIRKAVGLWARQGVLAWHKQFADPSHFLLGEVPLVGNRLIELTQQLNDDAESLLASEATLVVLPVPSVEIRQLIESAREKSIAQPRHHKEEKDAQPNVLHALWEEVAQVGVTLGKVDKLPTCKVAYDPEVYTAVYQHLLQHRHHQTLPINIALHPTGSAYNLQIGGTELAATPETVQKIIAQLEQDYTPNSLDQAVTNWFRT